MSAPHNRTTKATASEKLPKSINDGNVYYVETVNDKNKILHTKTMWKKHVGNLNNVESVDARSMNAPYDKRPITISTSNTTIPQENSAVNSYVMQENKNMYDSNMIMSYYTTNENIPEIVKK